MPSSEIRQYILELAEQEHSKLKITSEVMHKFGAKYHYSFKEWGCIVSEEINFFKTHVLEDTLVKDEDVVSTEEINSIQDSEYDIEKVCQTEKEEIFKNEPKTKFSVTEIDYSALRDNGIYVMKFGDAYEVSDIFLKNVFQRMLFHIGFMRVKELDIKVNSLPLIMYVFHNHFNYEKCLPYASYYIYKMNDEQIVETICEIFTKLEIEATLEKGNNVILKSFLSQHSSLDSLIPVEDSDNENSNNSKRETRQRIKINTQGEAQVGLMAQHVDSLNNKHNLQVYLDKIKKLQLKYKKGKLVPHVPIFILTLLELIDSGSIKKNQFKLDATMRLTYLKLWDRHSLNKEVYPSIEKPFVSLSTSSIWKLILYKNGDLPKLSIVDIQRNVSYAMLNQDLFNLLKIPQNRILMKDFIIRYYYLKP